MKLFDTDFLAKNDRLIVGFLGLGYRQLGQCSGSFRTCYDQLGLESSGIIGMLFRARFHARSESQNH
ncbi:hypothetical protein [Sinorhizobium meliloti]|uniref:hypothetical protein n=1 Tax=Rhizobium meliloti TaxID=382 RepID=UPI0013E3538C|nr:hypothetical protein [Sinorhizobium meliloti]